MRLTVQRIHKAKTYTIGTLLMDGKPCGMVTLEPAVRDTKIEGVTAIPPGLYPVKIDYSSHFGRLLPHVLGVPNFEGVRIHPGNTDKDTQGCILVGLEWSGGDFISHSREAFNDLFDLIDGAETVELEIA